MRGAGLQEGAGLPVTRRPVPGSRGRRGRARGAGAAAAAAGALREAVPLPRSAPARPPAGPDAPRSVLPSRCVVGVDGGAPG